MSNDNNTSLQQRRATVERARAAARQFANVSGDERNRLLHTLATHLERQQQDILDANRRDLDAARANALPAALIDRLQLDAQRVQDMAAAVRAVAALPDPLGAERRVHSPRDGLALSRRRIPLGLIFMIYESRPNVTVDAAALCLKSGNGVLLRGGREAAHSNAALGACWQDALRDCGVSGDLVQVWTDCSHEQVRDVLQWQDCIDLVIPRGGSRLINEVTQHSRIPVIKHDRGVCHLYVHREADLRMALQLLIDGKCRRNGVCNALEGLLVDAAIAADFLPQAQAALESHQVSMFADARARQICPQMQEAGNEHFGHEYLAAAITIAVVDDVDAAIDYICRYGSRHTEVICTQDQDVAEDFLRRVDASLVLVNASSRFNDGGELGLGAEIGISTSKLHAYGAMGLEALTSEKWLARGNGQLRHAAE